MVKHIRKVAFFEGLSLLALFFIAMPIKYLLGEPLPVRIVGMLHGILFLMFIYAATMAAGEQKWPKKQLWLAYISSFLPFGAWWFEQRYLKREPQLTQPY